jgi:hypothetical protein
MSLKAKFKNYLPDELLELTFPVSIPEPFTINFGDIKMKLRNWPANSIESGQTAQILVAKANQ